MSSPCAAPSFDTDAESEESTDEAVSDCFFCEGWTDYHPTCDRPGCDNLTHGFGPEGKRTVSYCNEHGRGPL